MEATWKVGLRHELDQKGKMSHKTLNQEEALPETPAQMESVQMVGKGTLYFQNGDVYIGSWRDGDFQDIGTLHKLKKRRRLRQ
jgi:hypothetical protein